MTTALDLITDAAIELGIIGAGQTMGSDDSAFMLRKLNQRVQTWSNLRLMIPTLTEISVPMTGAQSYTIGPSGADVTASRPLKVDSAYAVDSGGIEYPVEVLTRDRWHGISYKAVAGGLPDAVWYDAQNTSGRLYVYPKASSYTLKLQCLVALTSFASLSTACVLPEGYDLALILTLAEDCANAFGKPIPPDLRMRAKGARSAVKRTNTEPLMLDVSTAQPYQIERGF